MNETGSPEAWAEKAEHDLQAARQLLRRRQPLTDIVCLHAQQCAAKYLKALLVKYDTPPPRTHDLVVLNSLCASCGVIVPLREEARYAFEIGKAVRKFVKPLL